MHPLNPYASAPPDFAALCRADGQLAELVGRLPPSSSSPPQQQRSTFVDFTNAEVLRRVTEVTLKHDFGVTVHLRDDRLCPAVPNRLNYVAWIAELLDACHFDGLAAYLKEEASQPCADAHEERPGKRRKEDHTEKPTAIRILDVGTGASCIYPVLGRALHPGWEFVATDVDEVSIEHARSIIIDPHNNEDQQHRTDAQPRKRGARQQSNSLALRSTVHLIQRKPGDSLLLNELELPSAIKLQQLPSPLNNSKSHLVYHASMCNPPFYTNAEDMKASLEGKVAPPNAVQHGAAVEMLYDGGDVGFVKRMVEESVALSERVVWFTSMLGKLSSVAPVVDMLKQRQIANFYITELVQGQTKRWAVAWTFMPFRVPQPMVRISSSLLAMQPPAGRHTFSVDTTDGKAAMSCVGEELVKRSYYCVTHADSQAQESLIVYVSRDTWSRKARRQQQLQSKSQESDTTALVRDVPALGVRICATTATPNDDSLARLEALWIFGYRRQLFDSFVMSVIGSLAANRRP